MDRFTWRHDSILNFIANNLQSYHIHIITGDIYRPDRLILTKDNTLYVVELTVGYETNLRNNINRKHFKYKDLIQEQKKKFPSVTSVNLSISALGVFGKESANFLIMLERMDLDDSHVKFVIKKNIGIAIRSTYYIFCCRNKEWTHPELMKF